MQAQSRKKVTGDFFELVSQGRQKEGLDLFAPICRQHNPCVRGGMEALFDRMAAALKDAGKYSDLSFAVRNILAEGDIVTAHTELLTESKPGEGGLRQVHLFRFTGDKIVGYFDITQTIQPNMPDAANAFQGEQE